MKVTLGVSIATFALIITGAWKIHHPSDDPAQTKTEASPLPIHTFQGVHYPKMWTCNTVLYINETLVLRFLPPNAPFLGVIDPQGHFFYLVFPAAEAIGNLVPFVGSTCFENLCELDVNTTSLQADPYTYGVFDNQPVFTQSGVYTFIMGENLHVDNSDILYKVEVVYNNTHRSNQFPTTIAIK
jgi:hypothetical protein